ncbi:hypothetical protein NE237_029269 [Protea cynaroides]|uniref:OST-HTH associated domain-containing protein n=1 Tax=Protea cynaroides TaxID=273540 RepID=A0A9Q0GUY5_9MAGN|nr:hypothetical protein NE237_029269 [Protea cynaroides]
MLSPSVCLHLSISSLVISIIDQSAFECPKLGRIIKTINIIIKAIQEISTECSIDRDQREQMAQKLQKEGPVVLNDLSENDLLHVVDLLISEKKWVEEDPSKTFPFKLICHSRRGSSHPPGSNGLSSFSGKLSQSQSQGLPEHGMEKRDQNQFQPAACSTESNKKPSGTGKARHEILTDCQKLVTELLEEYPEGFNMGSFRKLFEERYGYILDYQMLGYSISGDARGSRLNGELKKEMKEQLDFSDEYLSDDELSDWECENVTLYQSDALEKSRRTEEDSSLIKILDSWYSSKEGYGHNDQSQKVEELVDCSRIDSKPSSSSNKAPVAKSGHKTKHVKKQTFCCFRTSW